MPQESERLGRIVRHAYDNAPAVREIMDGAGVSPDDIKDVSDLSKIPVTSKDKLAERQAANPPFGGFLAVPFGRLQHVFLSPGPLYEPSSGESEVAATVQDMFAIAGFSAGDVVINTFGYHLIPTGLTVDRLLTQLGVTVIPAGVGNADLQIKMMLDLGTTGYIGTPSWLMALITKAEERGVAWDRFSLRKVLVSAEPLPPALRQSFVDKYGLSVTNAYGTAELGFLAYNTEGGLAMRLVREPIVQVVDAETGQSVGPGEAGEVVGTNFSETYPLIRIGTGDLAINLDPAPGSSQQAERSIILVGRVGDAVKVRGMFVHPNQLRFALSQLPEITKAQAVITRPENRDELALRVVLSDKTTDRESLKRRLAAAIQSSCRVKVDRVEFGEADLLDPEAAIILDNRVWR